jgi:uncharacterized protein
MKFSEATSDARYQITRYSADAVWVNDQPLASSFIISPQTLIRDWRPQSFQALQVTDLETLFGLEAEVIIIGSGSRQQLPPPDIWKALAQHGVGFEIMGTDAACRTYNVLLGEARRIAAAFFVRD